MTKKFCATLFSLSFLSLVGCDEDQGAKYQRLMEFFKDNPVGMNGDFGVFKISIISGREPVVAVFGFSDNEKSCEDIAALFNKDEPNTYICEPLQKKRNN